jgi:adenosylcobinamide-GDP ribazoletransferase
MDDRSGRPEPNTREYAGLRLALTTLTILPLRAGRLDRATAARAMAWAPAVGMALGGLAAGMLAAVGAASGTAAPLLAAVLAIATLAVLTRGLHLDGLADTVDGLGLPGRERSLAVMKQSDIGAFGVLALLVAVLAQVAAVAQASGLGQLPRGAWAGTGWEHAARVLVCAVVTGRVAITWACRRGVPAARPDGLGALVAGTLPPVVPLLWSLAAVAGGGAWALATDHGRWAAAVGQGLAIGVAIGVAAFAQHRLVRRLGGITGDVLGALCEVATTVALVIGAIAAAR